MHLLCVAMLAIAVTREKLFIMTIEKYISRMFDGIVFLAFQKVDDCVKYAFHDFVPFYCENKVMKNIFIVQEKTKLFFYFTGFLLRPTPGTYSFFPSPPSFPLSFRLLDGI